MQDLHQQQYKRAKILLVVFTTILSSVACMSQTFAEETTQGQDHLNILVFAPHPDDEVLGCGGVISQALKQEKRVGVVVLTNGDGFPKAAAVVTKKPQNQLTPEDFLKLARGVQKP